MFDNLSEKYGINDKSDTINKLMPVNTINEIRRLNNPQYTKLIMTTDMSKVRFGNNKACSIKFPNKKSFDLLLKLVPIDSASGNIANE